MFVAVFFFLSVCLGLPPWHFRGDALRLLLRRELLLFSPALPSLLFVFVVISVYSDSLCFLLGGLGPKLCCLLMCSGLLLLRQWLFLGHAGQLSVSNIKVISLIGCSCGVGVGWAGVSAASAALRVHDCSQGVRKLGA